VLPYVVGDAQLGEMVNSEHAVVLLGHLTDEHVDVAHDR
jgi:hypothetical protein